MSIHVTDFKWEKGKNDLQYIELLEKTLKNEQAITAKAVAKIRELSAKNKEIRAKAIDDVFDFLKNQRDKKTMKVNFDDLEIRKYKEQLKGGV